MYKHVQNQIDYFRGNSSRNDCLWYCQFGTIVTINPSWQILENSSKYFFQNFSFPGVDSGRFLENTSNLFRNLHFPVMRPISGTLIHDSKFVNIFNLLDFISWTSFPEIGLAHSPILNKTEKTLIKFAWMCFPEIDLARAPETCH